jgi:peptidyl-prolyl cis-trans isomerase D
MLQTIRDRFTGVIAVLIVAAIGVALTITLVNTDSFTGLTTFAARVNGEEIPLAQFRQVAQQQILQQEEATRTATPEEAREQIERNVLEGMVRNRVVAQYVRHAGYRVGDGRVAEQIRGMPGFQVGGKFSNDGYLAALASQGVSPSAFEEERRAALQIEQLQNGLLDSSFLTPGEFRRFIVLEGERRRAAFVVLDVQRIAADVTVSDDEIKAYYDAHPDKFESQESIALDYVEAKESDVPAASEPTEAELRALYDANPERFRSDEQRRARHILIGVGNDTKDAAARKLAEEIKARLAKGEDFAALARQYSDDTGSAPAGGELGWAGKGTFVGPFEAALFSQDVGEISEPVKTEFGYHIIQLEEVRPGTERPFEEVRQELAAEARSKGSRDRFFALTEKMDDAALENPGSLDAVAKATGLAIRHIDTFTRSGGEPFGANRAVIEAAFSPSVLEEGENSALVEAGEGRAVILRVTAHRAVQLQPLEQVRADVEKAVRHEKAATLAAQRGLQLIERARAGEDFAALGAASGATSSSAGQVFTRSSQDAPPELVAAIFRTQPPAAGTPTYDGTPLPGGGFAVLRVDEVIPGNPDDIPREQRDARKTMLGRQAGIAEVTALAIDLRREAEVVVAPDLFESEDEL